MTNGLPKDLSIRSFEQLAHYFAGAEHEFHQALFTLLKFADSAQTRRLFEAFPYVVAAWSMFTGRDNPLTVGEYDTNLATLNGAIASLEAAGRKAGELWDLRALHHLPAGMSVNMDPRMANDANAAG